MGKAMGDKNGSGRKSWNDAESEDAWISPIRKRLAALTDERVKANSISVVPEQLQKLNVEAYKPKVVSIGPLHRGASRDMLYMEDIKWKCMLSLLHRTDDSIGRLTNCSKAILQLDELVRATYMDRIKVGSHELAKIMLLDGCFLLELLISNNKKLNEELKPPAKKSEDVRSGLESKEEDEDTDENKDKGDEDEDEDTNEDEDEDQGQPKDELEDKDEDKNKEKDEDEEKVFKLLHPSRPPTGGEEERFQSGWQILEKHSRKGEVLSDLKLHENQIPLFVIDMLYLKLFKEKAIEDNVIIPDKINSYALFLFGYSSDLTPVYSPNSAHVLELMHWFLTGKEEKKGKPESVGITIEPEEQSMVIRLEERDDNDPATSRDKKFGKETIPNLERCAARLHAAGIEIISSAKTLEEKKHLMFGCKKKFEQGKLEIQSLYVTKETGVLWRNFIALEQTRTTNKKFSEYALLFKGLVCCEHDIELLKTKEVLQVHDRKKWSNEKLKEFIHNIADGVQIDAKADSEFSEMINNLNVYKSTLAGTCIILMFWHYCRRFLTNTRYTFRYLYRILKRDHASTPWKALGAIAAVLLLLLTVAQTVLSAIGL